MFRAVLQVVKFLFLTRPFNLGFSGFFALSIKFDPDSGFCPKFSTDPVKVQAGGSARKIKPERDNSLRSAIIAP
jgi:hypothetical protein